jgi:hypothetical protein
MIKLSYRIVQGLFDDQRQMHTYHIVMTQYALLTDSQRLDGRGFETTDEKALEVFTKYCECREDAIEHAIRRLEELNKLPIEA